MDSTRQTDTQFGDDTLTAEKLEALFDLWDGRKMLRKLAEADRVELKVEPFAPEGKLLVLDPNDPFHLSDLAESSLPDQPTEMFLLCHPNDEDAAREFLKAVRPTPPERGGSSDA